MSVRIRMKRMGRTHRPFFRICAMDRRAPRDGRVLEELGTYDPSVAETDARAILKAERIDYWLSVGALPSEKVAALIKKYGTGGTHVEAQKASFDRLAQPKPVPEPGKPASKPQTSQATDETSPGSSAAGETPKDKDESKAVDEAAPPAPAGEENAAASSEEEAATG